MVESPLAAVFRAGADTLDQPALRRLAADLDAPIRAGVTGRPGAGRDTVRRALRGVGVGVGVEVEAGPTGDSGAPELEIRVFVEELTGEDRAALAHAPAAVAVMTKADLAGFGGAGPLAAAAARCRRIERRTGVPTRPLAALLAVAGSDPNALDGETLDGLRALAGGAARLPARLRRRLCAELDVFGVAVAVRALRCGADRAGVRAELLRASGVADLAAEIARAGGVARYRRVLAAVAAAERLATGPHGDAIARFLAGDEVVLARMAHAAEAAGAARIPDDDGAAQLRRAVAWQRVARDWAPDIVRGSLRLWMRAGGRPAR